MNTKKTLVTLAGLLTAVSASAFQITEKTCIVLPDAKDAHGLQGTFREAANALAADVCEATGLKLSVVTADAGNGRAGAIWLGEAAAAKAALVPSDLRAYSCVIAEKGGELYLFGRDRSGRKGDKGAGWMTSAIPTVKAVTDFEEQFMGVRFLGPGAVGREIPRTACIEVPDGTFRRHDPILENGTGRFSDLMNSVANANFGGGTWRTHGGHIYPAAFDYKKYSKTHPEYFALIGDSRAQSTPHNPLVCISNPEVKKVLIDFIVSEFDDGADVVELGQNDGTGFCQCGNCKAYGNTASCGEKFWIFHREIAEELYRLRPEKTVQIIAYGLTYEPPKTFREFPPNVMIEMMRYSPAAFEVWKDYKVSRGFSVYTYLWGGYYKPGMTVGSSIPQVAEAARLLNVNKVRGIYRCGSYELFGTEGPSYYVFAKLLDDPTRDEWTVFGEYCEAAYGPAANAMREFHKTLDERVRGYNKTAEGFTPPKGRILAIPSWLTTPEETLSYIYTPRAMKILDAFLKRAEATQGLSEKQRTRLSLVRLEFDYACHLGRILALYGAFQVNPTKAAFEPLGDAILARNAFIDGLYDAKGRMKKLPGWPEVRVLDNRGKPELTVNGHLMATLGTPFVWDVPSMRASGVIPGGPVKETRVLRLKAKPTLGDASFDKATENPTAGMELGAVSFRTSFRLGYDDENLYVSVRAELPDDIVLKPQGHDGCCFRQDCLEVYVDPTFAHARSFHFIWNALPDSYLERAYGLHTDPLDPLFGQFDGDWNGKWTYEVRREKGVWQSLVTLPFASLQAAKPRPGDKWYLNLGRESFPKDKPHYTELSLWSPSMEGRGPADREAMGIVTFE